MRGWVINDAFPGCTAEVREVQHRRSGVNLIEMSLWNGEILFLHFNGGVSSACALKSNEPGPPVLPDKFDGRLLEEPFKWKVVV